MRTKEKLLSNLWYNTPTSEYSSLAALFKASKKLDASITLKDVQTFLRDQEAYYKHRNPSRSVPSYIPKRRYLVTRLGALLAIDVGYLGRFRRGGPIKAFLLGIDAFSLKLVVFIFKGVLYESSHLLKYIQQHTTATRPQTLM